MGTSDNSVGPERRVGVRFPPPSGSELVLKPLGLGGLFIGNLAQKWVDVSEGGLKAVVSHQAFPGEMLVARIIYKPSGQAFMVNVCTKHISDYRNPPGLSAVGFSFVDPTSALRSCIRGSISKFPPSTSRPSPTKPFSTE